MSVHSLITPAAEIDRTQAIAAGQTRRMMEARAEREAAWVPELLAKIDASFADHAAKEAAKTPAQRKREFAASQIASAKAAIQGLHEDVASHMRVWGWGRWASYRAHRGNAWARLDLAARYRRNAVEALAEARKLEAQ